jgi:hypothetical protein
VEKNMKRKIFPLMVVVILEAGLWAFASASAAAAGCGGLRGGGAALSPPGRQYGELLAI